MDWKENQTKLFVKLMSKLYGRLEYYSPISMVEKNPNRFLLLMPFMFRLEVQT